MSLIDRLKALSANQQRIYRQAREAGSSVSQALDLAELYK